MANKNGNSIINDELRHAMKIYYPINKFFNYSFVVKGWADSFKQSITTRIVFLMLEVDIPSMNSIVMSLHA